MLEEEDEMNEDVKICTNPSCFKCNIPQPILNFFKNKTRKDGLSDECKKCKSLRDKKYYKKNEKKY